MNILVNNTSLCNTGYNSLTVLAKRMKEFNSNTKYLVVRNQTMHGMQ